MISGKSCGTWPRSLAILGFGASSLGSIACGAMATSPGWTGGGMELSAPARIAEKEAEIDRLAEEDNSPSKIGAKHILVMHRGSDRKPEGVTRTREEARKRAQECLVKLRGGADFGEMVTEYSDEPGAAERGGDLGVFEKRKMVKPFADAAFVLNIGEVSEVVETPFGFHIIQRTE